MKTEQKETAKTNEQDLLIFPGRAIRCARIMLKAPYVYGGYAPMNLGDKTSLNVEEIQKLESDLGILLEEVYISGFRGTILGVSDCYCQGGHHISYTKKLRELPRDERGTMSLDVIHSKHFSVNEVIEWAGINHEKLLREMPRDIAYIKVSFAEIGERIPTSNRLFSVPIENNYGPM